ncbi:tetratricopeptide repeat protein [bacterium]|nr:tetratricopeptide repeat protein [bacterium]
MKKYSKIAVWLIVLFCCSFPAYSTLRTSDVDTYLNGDNSIKDRNKLSVIFYSMKTYESGYSENEKGIQKMSWGDYRGARQEFESALRYNRDNYKILNNLAIVYLKLSHIKKADEFIQTSMELKMNMPVLLNNAGIISYFLKCPQKALKYLENAEEFSILKNIVKSNQQLIKKEKAIQSKTLEKGTIDSKKFFNDIFVYDREEEKIISDESIKRFSGTITSLLERYKIDGNENQSLQKDDTRYSGDVNLKYITEQLSGMNSETVFSGRYESYVNEKKLNINQFYINFKKKNSVINIWDIYPGFSPFTMDTSLQGAMATHRFKRSKSSVVYGRNWRGIEGIQYERFSSGIKFETKFNDRFNASVNYVNSADERGSIMFAPAVAPLENDVLSLAMTYRPTKNLKFNMEAAKSTYDEDTRGNADGGEVNDKAYMFETLLTNRKFRTKYTFMRVGTDFHSVNGIVVPDRLSHDLRISANFSKKLQAEASFRKYKDNLKGRENYTTYNENPNISVYIVPFLYKKSKILKSTYISINLDENKSWNDIKTIDTASRNTNIELRQSLKPFNWYSRYENYEGVDRITSGNYTKKITRTNGVDFDRKIFFKSGTSEARFYGGFYLKNEDNSPGLIYTTKVLNKTRDCYLGLDIRPFERNTIRAYFNYNDYDSAIFGEDLLVNTWSLEYAYQPYSKKSRISLIYRIRDNQYEDISKNFKEHYYGISATYSF